MLIVCVLVTAWVAVPLGYIFGAMMTRGAMEEEQYERARRVRDRRNPS